MTLSALVGATIFVAPLTPLAARAEVRSSVLASDRAARGLEATRGFSDLPVSFEKNVGQTDPRVAFVSRGAGYSLSLTRGGATLSLQKGSDPVRAVAAATPAQTTLAQPQVPKARSTTVRMRLAGVNPHAAISGIDRLPGVSNYLIGNRPSDWVTGVHSFAKVAYRDVYPGIGMVYHGDPGHLEYDFRLRPHADLRDIGFQFPGTGDLRLDRAGNLVVPTSAGPMRESAPVIYEMVGGRAVPVRGSFALRGRRVGFRVPGWDRRDPLVIDPSIVYSTYLGGTGFDQGEAVALDSSGNIYLAGALQSTDFPTANPEQPSAGGGYDAFIAKLDPTGTSLIYSTYIGGSGFDSTFAVGVDSAGQAYTSGSTSSPNFPMANAYQSSLDGTNDAFVLGLDASGSNLVYSTYLGGSGDDFAQGVAVDPSGDAFLTGGTSSTDFPTVAPYQSSPGPTFVTEMDPAGSPVYSTYFFANTAGPGMAVDPSGSAYVTGYVPSGGGDAFVAKFTPSGDALDYYTAIGGSSSEQGLGLAVDASGSAYATGVTFSSDFPTVGPIQGSEPSPGDRDSFLTKLSPSGQSFDYSTYIGGNGQDEVDAVAVDSSGTAYISGNTDSSNYPTVEPIQDHLQGSQDVFVSVVNPQGSAFEYSTYLGGSGLTVAGYFDAADDAGNVYLTGYTNSTDFATTPDAMQPDNAGSADAFLTKINTGPAHADLSISQTDAPDPVSSGNDVRYRVAVQNLGGFTSQNVVVTDTLDPGVTLVSADPSCSGTGPLTCNVGDIAGKRSVTFDVVVTVPTVGVQTPIENDASVSASTLDENSANDSSTETTTVEPPSDTSASGFVPPEGGDVSTGTTATVDDPVTLTMTLPPGGSGGSAIVVELPSCTPFPTCVSGATNWIPPAGYDEITATITYDASVLPAAKVSPAAHSVWTLLYKKRGHKIKTLPKCWKVGNAPPCQKSAKILKNGDLRVTGLINSDPKLATRR